MRIVGGRWKGRALAAVGKGDAAAHLRPTTDRVRESLFNVLIHGDYPDLEGARVLDLFSGTGALGFEALSRGAETACFVDNGAIAGRLIRKNIDILQCGSAVHVLQTDAARLGRSKYAPFDMAFVDPPYGKGLGVRAIAAAIKGGWLADNALVVLEEASEQPLPDVDVIERRRYGDTVVHFGTVKNVH